MTYLTRDQIFAAPDLPTEDVEVPEWGGTVRVRGLSGSARDEYEALRLEQGRPNLRAKFVSLVIVDEHGAPLFGEVDVVRLGQKSSTALERVAMAGVRLSGLTDDAGKDSEPDPTESGGSSSPSD
jgi:hypothetical protein